MAVRALHWMKRYPPELEGMDPELFAGAATRHPRRALHGDGRTPLERNIVGVYILGWVLTFMRGRTAEDLRSYLLRGLRCSRVCSVPTRSCTTSLTRAWYS